MLLKKGFVKEEKKLKSEGGKKITKKIKEMEIS